MNDVLSQASLDKGDQPRLGALIVNDPGPMHSSDASHDQLAPPTDGFKPAYPQPASIPTQLGPEGIRFDFNLGARLPLPSRQRGFWRVRFQDLDTGNVLFLGENQGALVDSAKRWFVRFRLEVWSLDEGEQAAAQTSAVA